MSKTNWSAREAAGEVQPLRPVTPTEQDVVARSILVTGVARSGTSLIGNIIHSCQGVEYTYEPPALLALFSKIEMMFSVAETSGLWQFFYESYLFRDFLMPALAGRRLNFRGGDESDIYTVKTVNEVLNRLNGPGRDAHIYPQALQATIAYKLPDILPYLKWLVISYPETRIVVMLRNPADVIASLRNKGWFSVQGLRQEWANWPLRAPQTPFWVPQQQEPFWLEANEAERCFFYYTWQYNSLLLDFPSGPPEKMVLLDYDSLIANPVRDTMALLSELGLHAGPKTDDLIGSIQPRVATRLLDSPLGNLHGQVKAWYAGKVP